MLQHKLTIPNPSLTNSNPGLTVTWCFNLGQSHSPPLMPHISLSGQHQSQPICVAAISLFLGFLALEKNFSKVASELPLFDTIKY
ncbi:hypothetical protein F5877DRAFT_82642 [Lentinula edodes]|nr:hypothetical protein F5877DRAFT_82642 [Lentinula edodes]